MMKRRVNLIFPPSGTCVMTIQQQSNVVALGIQEMQQLATEIAKELRRAKRQKGETDA